MDRYEIAKKLDLNLVEKRLGYHLDNNPNRLMKAGVKSVTVHQTDSFSVGADAESHHNYLRKGTGGRKVSWHYAVDEKVALQHFRDDRVTWHCGRAEGNESSISIEMCVDADKKGDKIMGEKNYLKTLDNGAKLVALLLVEHGLTLKDVKQHNDWSGKNCPSQIRRKLYGVSWSNFMANVGEYYNALTAPPKPVEPQVKEDRINGPFVNDDGETLYFRAIAGSYLTRAEAEETIKKLIDYGFGSSWLQAVYIKEKK